jgi:hypothetical protein
MAENRQFPHGVRGQELSLMSDSSYQRTSVAFVQAPRTMGIRQAFTGRYAR